MEEAESFEQYILHAIPNGHFSKPPRTVLAVTPISWLSHACEDVIGFLVAASLYLSVDPAVITILGRRSRVKEHRHVVTITSNINDFLELIPSPRAKRS